MVSAPYMHLRRILGYGTAAQILSRVSSECRSARIANDTLPAIGGTVRRAAVRMGVCRLHRIQISSPRTNGPRSCSASISSGRSQPCCGCTVRFTE